MRDNVFTLRRADETGGEKLTGFEMGASTELSTVASVAIIRCRRALRGGFATASESSHRGLRARLCSSGSETGIILRRGRVFGGGDAGRRDRWDSATGIRRGCSPSNGAVEVGSR